MRHKFLEIVAFISLFMFLFAPFAISQNRNKDIITAASSFTTGNNYRAMSELEQMAYVQGAYDGIMLIPKSDALDKNCWSMQIVSQMTGVTVEQLRAIVNKYLDEHPERWNLPMGILFEAAIGNTFLPHSSTRSR